MGAMASFPRDKLMAWYQKTRRDLPWRRTRDPYRIWVSEAMLQQTQVASVIPHYQRFLKRFPTVKTLAQAPVTDVLEEWSGLGYYSRAKNLHRAAREIVECHGGRLPESTEDLSKLPGVGRYTAGAIASIAYDRPAPILDGNVTRVLARYFGIRQDPSGPAVQRRLWTLATQLVPADQPGLFNQALMELGALVCTPVSPRCPGCPLKDDCLAARGGLQGKIPPPGRRAARKPIRYVCGILERNGSVLLARRPLAGLLPGLWEFPGGEVREGETLEGALRRNLSERLGIRVRYVQKAAQVRQLLTHRILTIHGFTCLEFQEHPRPLEYYVQTRWVPKRELPNAALTAGMSRLLRAIGGAFAFHGIGRIR